MSTQNQGELFHDLFQMRMYELPSKSKMTALKRCHCTENQTKTGKVRG